MRYYLAGALIALVLVAGCVLDSEGKPTTPITIPEVVLTLTAIAAQPTPVGITVPDAPEGGVAVITGIHFHQARCSAVSPRTPQAWQAVIDVHNHGQTLPSVALAISLVSSDDVVLETIITEAKAVSQLATAFRYAGEYDGLRHVTSCYYTAISDGVLLEVTGNVPVVFTR
jgi:hypothetical protein